MWCSEPFFDEYGGAKCAVCPALRPPSSCLCHPWTDLMSDIDAISPKCKDISHDDASLFSQSPQRLPLRCTPPSRRPHVSRENSFATMRGDTVKSSPCPDFFFRVAPEHTLKQGGDQAHPWLRRRRLASDRTSQQLAESRSARALRHRQQPQPKSRVPQVLSGENKSAYT